MLIELCAIVYREHKSSMDFLCSQKGHLDTEPHEGFSQFAQTCYVDTASSTKAKMSVILKLFSECSVSEDDLSFDIEPLAQETSNS